MAAVQRGLGEASSDKAFFGHPRGLSTLFFSEMWERFSYYGMRGFLLLYMTASASVGGMGLDAATAAPIYGMYTSMVYLTNLPGGWIADRLLGQRRAVLIGGILIASGHFSLAVPIASMFYLGLVLIVIGTGLLKPNISVMVGQLYVQRDVRRDAAFSIFYMGINLGAFIGPLITGYLAQDAGFRARLTGWGMDPNSAWHWGFGAAGVGMTLGLIQYVLGGRALGTAGLKTVSTGSPEKDAELRSKALMTLGIGAGLLVAFGAALATGLLPITIGQIVGAYSYVLFGITFTFFTWLFWGPQLTSNSRRAGIAICGIGTAIALLFPPLGFAGITLGWGFIFASESRGIMNFHLINAAMLLLELVLVNALGIVWAFWGRNRPTSEVKDWTPAERKRLGLIVVFFIAAALFWSVFEQAGSTLNLFADRSTENTVFGYAFPSSWWQSLNAFFIFVLAPVFAWLWVKLGDGGPKSPAKFAVGLIGVAVGFLILVPGAQMTLSGAKVGVGWLFAVYMIHTVAELCLSPVGLSSITKLAPTRVVSQMMGVWFLGASVGNFLGGQAASLYETMSLPTLLTAVAILPLLAGVAMFVTRKPLTRLGGDAL